MKLKIDFVTNSSSSSYILADKRKDKKSEITLSITVDDILKILDNKKFKNMNDLNNYFEESYGEDYLSNKYALEKFNKMAEIIRNDGEVIILEVRRNDNPLSDYLYSNRLNSIVFPEGIEVIDSNNYW